MSRKLDTLIFDPSPCGFPKPRVPPLPLLDGVSPSLTFGKRPSWAPNENFRRFTRGRYALREAYRIAGIRPGTVLLAPSYHCRTMLDPAFALGGEVILYPLDENLAPEFTSIQRLAAESPIPVKAVLTTHYFGIPQDFASLAGWCQESSITLVEDCSHGLFGQQARAPGIGRFGDFVTSSPYKFLPCPDGGLLYASDAHRLESVVIRPQGLMREVSAVTGMLANARRHRRAATTCNPDNITVDDPGSIPLGSDIRVGAAISADYDVDAEGFASLRVSKFVTGHADIDPATSRRRKNYRRWVEQVAGLPNCRPLFPELPEGCIPYMFPLHIDHPDPHFYQLKRLGVPIWRWDSIAASSCPTANDYRMHLLHLPCHQSLTECEMEWMIAVITKVSGGGTPGVER